MIMESLKLDQNEKETLEHIVQQMEKERGLDRAAAIAHMRFDFIEKVCDETVSKAKRKQRTPEEYEDRPHSDRKVYGNSVLYRNHGTCFLSDFQRDRCISAEYS